VNLAALVIIGLLTFGVYSQANTLPDDQLLAQSGGLSADSVEGDAVPSTSQDSALEITERLATSSHTKLANKSLPSAGGKKVAAISPISNWPMIIFTMFGMIALIFLLAWFVKRFSGMSFAANKDMKLVSSIALGAKERVCLVDVNGQNFLLGVTSQNINHLHTFARSSTLNSSEELDNIENSKQEGIKSEFAQKLGMLLKPHKQSEPLSGPEK